MAAAWEIARAGIAAKLDPLIAQIAEAEAAGEMITPSWLQSQRRYRELLEQIDSELLALTGSQAGPLADAQRDAVEIAATHAQQMTLAGLGDPPAEIPAQNIAVVWNQLPVQAVEAIVGYASDGSPLRDLLDEFGTSVSLGIRERLITGVAAGTSAQSLARDLEAFVGKAAKEGDEAAKATGLSGARALNIVRTEYNRAARSATRESYNQNADIIAGWIWIASCDLKTCSCCWAMHGTVHGMDETLDGHPSCRCCMAPQTRSWAEIMGDDSLPDTRPTVETGEDRFANLSEDDQKAILGPTLYEHYKQGTVALPDLVHQTSNDRWGTMRREATVTEALDSAEARK